MIMNDYYSTGQECQTWLDYALECGYIHQKDHNELYGDYDNIIGKLVNMINNSDKWCLVSESK